MTHTKEQGRNKGKGVASGWVNLEKGKWKKGQSGNPRGRKPRYFVGLAKQLNEDGFDQVTKEQLKEAFQLIIGLDKDAIFRLANDPLQPWAIHIITTRFLSRDGYDMLKDMLDRAHGKLTQNESHSSRLDIGLADFLKGG